jgi:hypothetical protein
MQQRRLRLGDVLDDYCPRERRITNHAVVAMIDDTVKQTRCTTCDAEHEYKEARVPAARRRKTGAPAAQLVEGSNRAADVQESHEDSPLIDDVPEAAEMNQPEADTQGTETQAAHTPGADPQRELAAAPASDQTSEAGQVEDTNTEQDEWPVHRPLIRATLPRPEGHTPERKAPDFTFRPAGGRFDSRNGQRRAGGHRQARNAQGQSQSGQSRFGGQRGPGPGGGPPGQRQGNRPGQGGGAGRPGQGRGPRPGGGRKRGR